MAVKTARFVADLGRLESIGLDSSILIYHLDDISPYVELTEAVFAAIAAGGPRAVLSTVSMTELLTKPFAEGATGQVETFEQFVLSLPHTAVRAPDYPIAKDAARLRARYGLRTPDALLVATARHAGVSGFLTNDTGLRKLKAEGLAVLVLDDYL